MKPDFICIGAQRSGTTWLYRQLSQHPEFSMPPIKEFHYFDRSPTYPSPNTLSETKLAARLRNKSWTKKCIKDILTPLRSGNFTRAKWWARYHLADYSDEWYTGLFKLKVGITGDVTPSYSILEETDVRRLHKTVPDAKIIFLIRNPIDRAWSMLRHWSTGKWGPSFNLADFEAFKSQVDSPNQELRSDYIRTIDLFSKYFDSSRFLIGFYDALVRDPRGLLRAIYTHLEANDIDFHVDPEKTVNKSPSVECPTEFRAYLTQKYTKAIEELSKRYGSYANEWLRGLIAESAEQMDGADRLSPVVHP